MNGPTPPFDPDWNEQKPSQQNPRCTVTVVQELIDGRMVTKVSGKIEPGGLLTNLAVVLILHDATSLLLQKMIQAEQEGKQKKSEKPSLWTPEIFRGMN